MRTGLALLACVLCAAPVVLAQQYSDENRGYSSGMSRDTESSDWYGDTGRSMREDTYRDRSAARQSQLDRGTGRYSQYDQGYGYGYRAPYGSEYGRGTEEDWQSQRGMDQGYGQGWSERDQFRGQGFRQERMGAGQSVAIIGQLTNEDARVSGINPNHKVVELQTQSGSTLFVDLGPDRQQVEDLNLSRNQSLFARGHLINVGGQRVLMAREIAQVSNRVTLHRGGPGQQEEIYGFRGEQRRFGQQDQSQKFRSKSGTGQSQFGQSGQSQFGQSQQNQQDQSGQSGGSSSYNQPGSSGSSGSSSGSSGSPGQ